MSAVSPDQLQAFHATHYQVHNTDTPFTLRIGEPSRLLEFLHQIHTVRSSAFLTAWNPLGKELPSQVNAERQSALLDDLHMLGAVTVDGRGIEPTTGWTEDSFLSLGLTRDQAIALGNKFGQLAIIFNGADAIPELILLQ